MRAPPPPEISEFSELTSEKPILDLLKDLPRRSQYSTEEIQMWQQYCLALLQNRQQRNLLLNQNEYNKATLKDSEKLVNETKNLSYWTKVLAVATWALVGATVLLVYFSLN